MAVKCEFCGQAFGPGQSWNGSNMCRAAYILPYVESCPRLSAWELSKESGLSYAETVKALEKAREWEMVEFEPEERESGGARYRYTAAVGWMKNVADWKAKGRI